MQKIVAAAVLAALFLAGCSGAKGGDADPAEIFAAIKDHVRADLEAAGYSDEDFQLQELPGYRIVNLQGADFEQLPPGIRPDDFREGYMLEADMMLNADRIILFQAEKGKAGAIQDALELYQAAQLQMWEQYMADQAEKVRNTIISARGDLVIYITYPDADAIVDIFAKHAGRR
ncbi:MAG TPA: DUF4358 domain-containing protein [Bacillota bacterium]|nr:DUF4358 domain-containing protein [Bacillota bacterium]